MASGLRWCGEVHPSQAWEVGGGWSYEDAGQLFYTAWCRRALTLGRQGNYVFAMFRHVMATVRLHVGICGRGEAYGGAHEGAPGIGKGAV